MKKIVSLLLTLMLAVGLLTGCTDPKELYDNEDAIAGGSSAFEALNWAESSLLPRLRKRRLYFAKGRSLNLQNRHRAWMGLTALLRCPLPKRRKVRLASSWRLFWQWPLLAAA